VLCLSPPRIAVALDTSSSFNLAILHYDFLGTDVWMWLLLLSTGC
jgi:hypothetical protein